MRNFELIIDENYDNKTVKEILYGHFRLSGRLITKLKLTDGIKLNGESVTVRRVLKKGDKLLLILPDGNSDNVIPVNIPIEIIYEDNDILVVNKPQNMPTHPTSYNFDNTLGNAVKYLYKDEPFTYRPVNRLDKDTTGCLIVAKTAHSAFELSKQMQKGLYKKTYVCITEGVPNPKEGIIDAPIKKTGVLKREVVSGGQDAITEYKTLEEKDGLALVEAKPITGRTHQIRVHLKHIGCPLLNDFLYGKEGDTPFMLHCKTIEFYHPVTKEKMKLEAPIPEYFTIKKDVD